jgi:EpsI family protein
VTKRALVLVAALVATGAILRATERHERVPPRRPLAELPQTIAGWRAVENVALDPATLAVLKADDYVSRRYAAASTGGVADLFVGYYASQSQGDTLHSPMNCLPAAGWQPVTTGTTTIEIGGRPPITSNRDVIQKGLDSELVYYWYQSHGRTIASEYASKAYLVFDAIRLHRSDAAIVRVIVPMGGASRPDAAARAFIAALAPALDRHLPR